MEGKTSPELAWPCNRKIIKTRAMNSKEIGRWGWDGQDCAVLELDDGSIVFASRDSEGNGPGVLCADDQHGNTMTIIVRAQEM